ncbi:MAG: flagellar hook-basal body complex protein [bacterium]|nr:flagellar hook-basal body complex protein [bacterium]
MLRSLFAGVSGLINHQTKLDVIGNNIANINTIGFKSGRVSFQELLNQTVRGASRPASGVGGSNALQIGLGMGVASVDSSFTQGNLQSTGNMFDFAFQGDGFFAIGMGDSVKYTRAGGFALDGAGNLVHQSSGGILQGYLPDDDGVIRESSTLQDIVIDNSQVVSASATTFVGLTGNLKADSEAAATITETGKYMKIAQGTDTLLSLSQQNLGLDLGVRLGDNINISGMIGATMIGSSPAPLEVTATTSLQEVVDFINASIVASDGTYPVNGVNLVNGVIVVDQSPNGGTDIFDLRLNIEGNPEFNNAFTFPSIILGGMAGAPGDMSQALLTAAETTDLLIDLYNYEGMPLSGPASDIGLEGITLTIQAYVGGEANTPRNFTIDNTTTMQELMNQVQSVTGITNFGGSGVELMTDGTIRVTGNTGLVNEITSISIADAASQVTFGNTFIFNEIQAAKDTELHPVSVDIYDSVGAQHHLTLTFRKPQTFGDTIEWYWEASIDGTSALTGGDRGRLVFSPEGELVSFSYDDGSAALRISPDNGAEIIDINIQTQVGSSTLTQTAGYSSAKVVMTDGYASGSLESVFVDETGTIVGQFSNGVSDVMAQVAVANFANSSGLIRSGSNLFSESSNSGRSIIGTLKGTTVNSITPGALEMSNVNLAAEFTEMITAQRGFQANARIISTGDEMLNELVNIKR